MRRRARASLQREPAPFDTFPPLAYSVEFAGPRAMKQFIYAYVVPEGRGFQGQCFDPLLTVHADSLQGAIDETTAAIRSRFCGQNLHQMGFAPQPRLVTTLFLAPLKRSW